MCCRPICYPHIAHIGCVKVAWPWIRGNLVMVQTHNLGMCQSSIRMGRYDRQDLGELKAMLIS